MKGALRLRQQLVKIVASSLPRTEGLYTEDIWDVGDAGKLINNFADTIDEEELQV